MFFLKHFLIGSTKRGVTLALARCTRRLAPQAALTGTEFSMKEEVSQNMAAMLMEDPHQLSSEGDILSCTSHALSTLGLAGDGAFQKFHLITAHGRFKCCNFAFLFISKIIWIYFV